MAPWIQGAFSLRQAVARGDTPTLASLLALVYRRVGWEMGTVKRSLENHRINWGYFFDHNPFEPHCNAHPNNYIVLPPVGHTFITYCNSTCDIPLSWAGAFVVACSCGFWLLIWGWRVLLSIQWLYRQIVVWLVARLRGSWDGASSCWGDSQHWTTDDYDSSKRIDQEFGFIYL